MCTGQQWIQSKLKGDFNVTDPADSYSTALVRRRWWLLWISKIWFEGRHRYRRDCVDCSGDLVPVRWNAYVTLRLDLHDILYHKRYGSIVYNFRYRKHTKVLAWRRGIFSHSPYGTLLLWRLKNDIGLRQNEQIQHYFRNLYHCLVAGAIIIMNDQLEFCNNTENSHLPICVLTKTGSADMGVSWVPPDEPTAAHIYGNSPFEERRIKCYKKIWTKKIRK